ncbi:MAG: 2,3-bisphosphoglycerate-independent phosphoglycerate mutase [Chloroflexota bacterium]|nr:2,3-bisphosphoglycerate-independent phosphoglycerate mutase [Chloroflexota bacterium]
MTFASPTLRARPVVLCVLDGFGIGHDDARNPLCEARMPNWERLLRTWPHGRLAASGEAVGLPTGQMGNSEVGHLNLGAGFPVLQDLPRIDAAIAEGSFFTNAALTDATAVAVRRGTRLHLVGLIGPGGVHAHDRHIVAAVELARRAGLPRERVTLHAITDGRDTPPRSAGEYVAALEGHVRGAAAIATLSGRFYAMDRDGRWERTRRAYDAMVHGVGRRAADAVAAVHAAYALDEGDEFIEPTVIDPDATVSDGDVVIHMNFRADRARQLTRALSADGFADFDRGDPPERVVVATLTEYQVGLPVTVAFPPERIDSLAAYLGRLDLRQLHVAETEKYAHVTYFFNGGVEAANPGEDRELVASVRHVPTYDLAPEMSAGPITQRLVAAIGSDAYDFAIVNYANPDMVGHTGVWGAAVRAAEVVDACLGRLERAVLDASGVLLVTGDHGNIEELRDDHGEPKTEHTTNPVPLVIAGAELGPSSVADGRLADVAPTILNLMGLQRLSSMTGRSLVDSSRSDPA